MQNTLDTSDHWIIFFKLVELRVEGKKFNTKLLLIRESNIENHSAAFSSSNLAPNLFLHTKFQAETMVVY